MTKEKQYRKLHEKLAEEYKTTLEVIRYVRNLMLGQGRPIERVVGGLNAKIARQRREMEFYRKITKSSTQKILKNTQIQLEFRESVLAFLGKIKAQELDEMLAQDI